MMNARVAVGRGWAFVESIMRPSFPQLDAFIEYPSVFPEPKDILFQLNEVGLGFYFTEHG
jgi:hypothetical protein